MTTVVVGGQGDVVDPEAWQDSIGNVPPFQYTNVPYNVNYPLNGDGRYWFTGNAYAATTGVPIQFIGSTASLQAVTGEFGLQWSVVQSANDGSTPMLAYLTSGSAWTTVSLTSAGAQLGGIQNGEITVIPNPITTLSIFQIQIYMAGGTSLSTATQCQVALAITRNDTEYLTWDSPNPFNPAAYNALSNSAVPVDTLANLRVRVLNRLGFANQSSNPPPGMTALINDFLSGGQTFLYKRYLQLSAKRYFRWKINPGQRFYGLNDNDESPTTGLTLDPLKSIDWVGIQDSRNVWYPMIQGIPPQLFTMITKPWRPARYEIGRAIEIYPAPDQTYWLWIKGCAALQPFNTDNSFTSIDSELVFLWALATAKAHYGQPDANNVATMANAYKAELIAGTHQTAHYLPGTIAVPPAVRPTLIQFGPQGS